MLASFRLSAKQSNKILVSDDKERWTYLADNMSEERECNIFLLWVRLLKTLLKLIKDINIVWCLNFNKHFDYPK